jgi:iron complex transport system substrate-binding protein
MQKKPIIGIILIIVIASAVVIGIVKTWFQPQTQEPPQTTSYEPLDLTLEIYGNANMDDRINQTDIDYLTNIIAGTNATTTFSDANKDGTIDQADIEQVTNLINNNASYIILLDGNGVEINVALPATRIIVEYIQNAELIRVLQLEDQIVGVDYCIDQLKDFYFPNNTNIVSVGQMSNPDYEVVLEANPDILLTFTKATAEKAAHLPGVDVVYLGLYYPNVTCRKILLSCKASSKQATFLTG